MTKQARPTLPLPTSMPRPTRFATAFSALLLSVALPLCGALALAASVSGCTQAYYSAMEKVGQHKRDILRSRIEAGREDQEEAQEQFQTTYERFADVARFDGGNLESIYNRLNDEFERSEARAEDVSERIDSIERVAADFFAEWEGEIEERKTPSYRANSQRSLRESKGRYSQLINAMKRAESKMPPVLDAFRDQVLYLKHSLNAQAVAALEGTLVEIESDVASLIRDIDISIKEAESFLSQLDS